MAGKLNAPNTGAGRAFNETGPSADAGDVREFGTEQMKSRVVDEYSVSKEEREELGIQDDEHIVYPARDESWGSRRFAQIRRRYGTARQIKHPVTGVDPCEHMMNIMVAVPKAAYEARDAERAAAARENAGPMNPRTGIHEKEVELFERDETNFRLRREHNGLLFEEMGIGQNSDTKGMSLEEGLRYYERRGIDVNALADKARRGGHHSDSNRAEWGAAMKGEPKKTFNIGAEFAPEVTPNSALGQVRNRTAKPAPKGR